MRTRARLKLCILIGGWNANPILSSYFKVNFFDQVEAHILNDEDGIFFATYADCRPTGDAFVLFVDNLDADRALTRHRNYLGQRYVEVFKASPSEAVQVRSYPSNRRVINYITKVASNQAPKIYKLFSYSMNCVSAVKSQ